MTNLRSILLGSAAAMAFAVGPAMAQTPEPAETVTEEVGEAGQVIVEGAEEVGEAGANVVAEGAAEVQEGAAETEMATGRWAETYGETYGEFGDRNVEELVGTDVVSAEGNNIGEVDNFVLMGDQLAAVVGIGGFLGMGEHSVALALSELTWNGEQLVVEGYTEDQLRELPAYDEAGGTVIGAGTLREGYNTAAGQPMQPAEPATEGAATDMAATGTAPQPAEGESAELQAVEEQIEQEADEVQAEAGAAAGGATNLTEQAQAETAEATEAEPVEGSTETAAETAPTEAAPAADAPATNLTEQAGGTGTVPLESAETDTAATTTEPPAEGEAEVAAEATTPPAEGATETAAATTEPPAEGEAEVTAEATTPPAESATETAATTEPPAEAETEVAAEPTTPPAEGAAEVATTTTEPPAEGETEMAAETTAPAEGSTETAAMPAEEPAEGTAETAEVTTVPAEGTAEMAAGDRWTEDMNNVFGDIADLQVAELIGTDVAGADGEVVGQVDNFALMGEQVVAVVGVGGFLGLGEHNVGLPLDQLTWDGERLVLSGMTEEDLRNMPAYDEAGGAFIEGESTLRGTYEQM